MRRHLTVSFDLSLKRHFPLVIIGLIATMAYFQAKGTSLLLAASMTALPAAAASVTHASKGTERVARSAAPILSRNAFDSLTGPIRTKSETEAAANGGETELGDPLGVEACEGVKVLIVTESSDPVWSMAALQGPGETVPKLRRVGDEVGGKRVAYIGYNPRSQNPSVWLESGESVCQSMLFATAVAAVATAATAAAKPDVAAQRGLPKVSTEIAAKIQKVSDSEFRIDRAAVDKILGDTSSLMKIARFAPVMEDGKLMGLRLLGVRADTLLGALGMRNGDRIETINGFDMASPEKALEAYLRLRTADDLKVQITRQGVAMTIGYRIQ